MKLNLSTYSNPKKTLFHQDPVFSSYMELFQRKCFKKFLIDLLNPFYKKKEIYIISSFFDSIVHWNCPTIEQLILIKNAINNKDIETKFIELVRDLKIDYWELSYISLRSMHDHLEFLIEIFYGDKWLINFDSIKYTMNKLLEEYSVRLNLSEIPKRLAENLKK